MFDLSRLSPEEKDEILQSVLSKAAVEGDAPPQDGGDQEQDEALVAPLVQALEYLIQKVEQLETKLCGVEKVVMDDIIGGITNLYDENIHAQKKSGIMSKYGEKFKPFEGAIKELYPNEDLYEQLLEELEELRKGEGYTEELEGSHVDGIASKLKEKFGKVTESMAPKAAAVEVTTVGAGEGDDLDKAIKKLKGNPRMPR